jgi:flagellar capping protein FliD
MTNLTEYVRSQLLAMAKSIELEADRLEKTQAERKTAYDENQERMSRMREQAAELRVAAGGENAA